MARAQRKPVDDEESTRISAFDEPTLDDFLLNNQPESELLPQNGMPPLNWLKATFKTKSAGLRYLVLVRGFTVKDVAKHTGIRYQQVRNVTTKYLKRGANEDYTLPPNAIDPSLASSGPAGAEITVVSATGEE